jgi:hypothetical protein
MPFGRQSSPLWRGRLLSGSWSWPRWTMPRQRRSRTLLGRYWPACGITLGRVSSGPTKGVPRYGDWRHKTEFNGIGGLRTHIRNCAGPPPGTLQARRPQLFPPRWGRFFWAAKAARRGGHLRVNPEGLAEVNRNGAKVAKLCLVAFRVRHNSPKGPSACPRAGAFSLGNEGSRNSCFLWLRTWDAPSPLVKR